MMTLWERVPAIGNSDDTIPRGVRPGIDRRIELSEGGVKLFRTGYARILHSLRAVAGVTGSYPGA